MFELSYYYAFRHVLLGPKQDNSYLGYNSNYVADGSHYQTLANIY